MRDKDRAVALPPSSVLPLLSLPVGISLVSGEQAATPLYLDYVRQRETGVKTPCPPPHSAARAGQRGIPRLDGARHVPPRLRDTSLHIPPPSQPDETAGIHVQAEARTNDYNAVRRQPIRAYSGRACRRRKSARDGHRPIYDQFTSW